MDTPISIYTSEICEKIAIEAALRYVNDQSPGIYRRKCGKGFAYYNSKGNRLTDLKQLQRIKMLAIPPAYQYVWICPFANGHIQATGWDARGRKQYIYHSLWHEIRQQNKFNSLIQFGQCLPQIRQHVMNQLDQALTLNKSQVVCAILYLLDIASIRIGSTIYAKQNKSYGLTTLRKKHLSIKSSQVILDFQGKNKQLWHIILRHKKIIKLLKKCEEIPGYELFKYQDEDNKYNVITSQDINFYLQALTQYPFTAKDFRTWAACREVLYLMINKIMQEDVSVKNDLNLIIKEVAATLRHTPTICKKNYIHPEIISWWDNNHLLPWLTKNKRKIVKLTKDELLLFWLLDKELHLQ